LQPDSSASIGGGVIIDADVVVAVNAIIGEFSTLAFLL
jgi:UDP-3-O-[3-hydroxymyristoyl] glucosamine N-acyltransferase